MKKSKLGTILFLSILGSPLNADGAYYIGADLGSTKAEASVRSTGLGLDESESDSGGSQTLKAGRYFDSNNRAAVFYHNINAEDSDFGIFGLEYDYLFGENDLKPFAGAVLGYGRYKLHDPSFEITGLVYGVQAGINYEINTDFSVEAGVRLMRSTLNETYRYLGWDADFAIDNFRNWYIGINYVF